METLNMAIIEEAQNGNSDSFASLYDAVWRDLFRYAYYVLGVREDAEDAVQECILEAYKGIVNLKSSAAFKSYVFSILYRACKRRLKSYIQEKKCIPMEELADLSDNRRFDADMIASIQLKNAISALPDEDRLIVMMSVVGGYSSSEIARVLQKPDGTVRSRLSRTLRKLKNEMA